MNHIRTSIVYIIVTTFIFISACISTFTLFRQSLRLDESQSLWVATKSITAILQYIALDVHVPLYELLLHFWLQIFGTSIIAARSLSLLFFLLSIPVLYKLTSLISTKTVALLTIALYSLSPFIVWYSFEARMYSLFTFVVCISHYFFLQVLQSKGNKGVIGYFFSTFLGLYTHYFFLLLIASQGVFLLMYFSRRYDKSKSFREFIHNNKYEIVAYVKPLFLSFLLFLPWLIYFKIQGLASNTQPVISAPTAYNLFQTVVNFIFGFQTQTIQSLLIALWPLAVIPLFFFFTRPTQQVQLRHLPYFILTTALPVVLVFFLSYVRPIYLVRYLILVTPGFFLLLAWSLFYISKGASRSVISIVACFMFISLLFQNVSAATPVKENYQGVSDYLYEHATPRDVITVSSPFTIYPIMYYYKGNTKIDSIPHWDLYSSGAIPTYSTAELTEQMNIFSKSYQNIYVVLSYDQGYEDTIKKYLDTHYQRISIKSFSSGLELREYKLRY